MLIDHALAYLFLGGVGSLLTELFADCGIVFMFIFCQFRAVLPAAKGLMIFGLIISFFWMTRRQASFSLIPEWFVVDVIVIKLSENLSIPSGQIEWDLIIMLKLFRFRNEFKLSGPKFTMLFCFYGSRT